jgi:hypothetical protein
MSSSVITKTAKVMPGSRNGYLSMSLMTSSAHSAIRLCTRFIALLRYRLRAQASTLRIIDEDRESMYWLWWPRYGS